MTLYNIDANLFLDDTLNGGVFTAGKWQCWSYLLINAVAGHTLISFPFSRLACLHFLFSLIRGYTFLFCSNFSDN
jgi:hypothetical protein